MNIWKMILNSWVLLSLLLGNTQICLSQEKQNTNVSLIKLIATPDRYNGTRVRTMGYAGTYSNFNMALYCSENDYKNDLELNSVELRLTADQFKLYKDFNKKYVLIDGTFSTMDIERGVMFSGTIKEVTNMEQLH